MKKLDFNGGWTCRCLTRPEEAAQSVHLPHDAMIAEPRNETSRGEGNIGWFIGGDYAYEKTFTVPSDYQGGKLILHFEGVMKDAEVYIDGEKAGSRPYGYTDFYIDAGRCLKGSNLHQIRVVCHNSEHPNSRWYSGTGIYRPVWLLAGKERFITPGGIRLVTKSTEPPIVRFEVRTNVPGPLTLTVTDPDQGGAVIASCQGEAKAPEKKPNPMKKSGDGADDYDAVSDYGAKAVFNLPLKGAALWSPEHPKLYTCRVQFGEDVSEETFGIRSLAWDEKKGMTLNGERVILRGACIHHDNGLLGAATYPEAEERRVRILKANGYNAIRSAHNPCSTALLEACDKVGMFMMDEFADCWYIHKTPYDYVLHLMDWWKADLRDMVNKDLNHPCVIMYSTGNEVSETAQEKGIRFTKEMTEYLHHLDPTRPVTCGVNIFFNFLSSMGMGVYSDEKAQKMTDAPDGEKKEKKKPVGSEFYNLMAATVGNTFMKLGATIPPCDWKTRDAYNAMDIAGYNYGIFRYKRDLKKKPHRLILGSETLVCDAYRFWEIARDNPRIIGDFVWAGMDYMGECGEGGPVHEFYRDGLPITCRNGRVDLLGKRRAEALFTLTAFEQDPGPFLAVKPLYFDDQIRVGGWGLTESIESWSFRGCEGKTASVEVYARAAAVELFLNGKSLGQKSVKACRAFYEVPYENGELKVIAYNEAGQQLGDASLTSAGEGLFLHISPEEAKASEGRLIFAPISFTDENGIWRPDLKTELTVTVENGRLLGLGSANPYLDRNYTSDTVMTYFGEAMAIVQAGKKENGPVSIRVSGSKGSAKAVIEFE